MSDELSLKGVHEVTRWRISHSSESLRSERHDSRGCGFRVERRYVNAGSIRHAGRHGIQETIAVRKEDRQAVKNLLSRSIQPGDGLHFAAGIRNTRDDVVARAEQNCAGAAPGEESR